MSYSVSDLKSELTGVLHGQSLGKVFGLDVLINRAARKLISDVDPIETIRIQEISSPIFNRVFDYPIPEDLKGDRVIDIRPQVNRGVQDRFLQYYNEPFDVFKLNQCLQNTFTVQYNTAQKSIRISENLLPGILVNAASTIQDNGTWSVTGTATNLQEDDVNFAYQPSSIRWDAIAGANPSSNGVTNSTMTPVDLSRDTEQGSEFLYVFLPTASNVFSCTLKWGSSTGNFYSRTVTTNQFGNAFADGWNLLQFRWQGATQTGTVDETAINFVDFSISTNGTADFAFRLNDVNSQLGTIMELEYYSKFLFRDATTGAFQETVTDDSNIINLDTDSYNVLFNHVAYLCAQQIQGADSKFDATFFFQEYDTSLKRYVAKIKSQVLKPTQSYYTMRPAQVGTIVRYSSS